MIKLVILILILYFGYRLFFGPPLLRGRDNPQVRRERDEDGYTDYEEIT